MDGESAVSLSFAVAIVASALADGAPSMSPASVFVISGAGAGAGAGTVAGAVDEGVMAMLVLVEAWFGTGLAMAVTCEAVICDWFGGDEKCGVG